MKDKWRNSIELIMLFCILFVLLPIFSNGSHDSLQADEVFEPYEIFLTNLKSSSVAVKVEPVGMIFNDIREYSLVSAGTISGTLGQVITGTQVSISAGKIKGGVANHALTSTPDGVDRHICYGRYKITIEGYGYFYVDFSDADYPAAYGSAENPIGDLFFAVDGDQMLWVSEQYPSGGNVHELSTGELVKVWDQTIITGRSKIPNKNGFEIPAGTNMPLNGSDGVVTHIDPHQLYVNADVQGNVNVTNNVTIESGAALKLQTAGTQAKFNAGKKLTVNGTLTVQGQSSNPITFTASGSSWNGIYFASLSSGTLKYCVIDKLTGGWASGGITINGSTSPND